MNSSGSYKIRPAGRHILTIGRDLIQDSYAAVLELVKNAYDADSPDVEITFLAKPLLEGYSITIEDHGHGMSRDTIINKWMVPSTRDKLDRRKSPLGRIMQGRKGVGRYAASILGGDLLLETTTSHGEKTTLFVEWDSFDEAQYLDDVEILIETTQSKDSQGTRLTINGNNELLSEWSEKQFKKLRFELKKLISPVNSATNQENDFSVFLKISGFNEVQDVSERIEPYPIFDLFDYKISGKVDANGQGQLEYSLQKARNTTVEQIQFELGQPTACGELFFDIRVYDREKDAIDSLIGRGLRDESGNYVGKLQARQLLNEYNGIGVYRNGFRIRPLGDADFDWLKLNEQRVQNPSLRIGSNQVIGYVQIQSEELSGLTEKSARDGLRENEAFNRLKDITKNIIAKLEERRFEYRKKAGLSRPVLKVERQLEQLFSSDSLKKSIRSKLNQGGVDLKTTGEIIEILDRDADDKNKTADEIRQAVAIYQGQATLGKIMNVILHEGRRHLNYFRNQVPNLQFWYDSFVQSSDAKHLENIIPIVKGIGENADFFSKLFKRLDPLAAGKRPAKKLLELKTEIHNAVTVLEPEFRWKEITLKITGSDTVKYSAWKQDIFSIFTNLVDNSIYWIAEKESRIREINIDIVTDVDTDTLLFIDYRDTGPGIESSLIDSEVIFEPQFSTKPSGTGLGLAIAGEAATRIGLELVAIKSDDGAWFRLQTKDVGELNE